MREDSKKANKSVYNNRNEYTMQQQCYAMIYNSTHIRKYGTQRCSEGKKDTQASAGEEAAHVADRRGGEGEGERVKGEEGRGQYTRTTYELQ